MCTLYNFLVKNLVFMPIHIILKCLIPLYLYQQYHHFYRHPSPVVRILFPYVKKQAKQHRYVCTGIALPLTQISPVRIRTGIWNLFYRTELRNTSSIQAPSLRIHGNNGREILYRQALDGFAPQFLIRHDIK